MAGDHGRVCAEETGMKPVDVVLVTLAVEASIAWIFWLGFICGENHK